MPLSSPGGVTSGDSAIADRSAIYVFCMQYGALSAVMVG